MTRCRSRQGQGLTEYALVLALVAIMAVGALITGGNSIGGAFDTISNSLVSVGGPTASPTPKPTATPKATKTPKPTKKPKPTKTPKVP